MATDTPAAKADIRTDDKKQHFDDIYVAATPVPYKLRILDELTYISDNFNREMFDAHILPWIQKSQEEGDGSSTKKIQFLDLCACFGNTTMATVHGMTYDDICENWKDEETACGSIHKPRRFDCHTTAVDISGPAMAYGKSVGLYDTALVCNLNDRSSDVFTQTVDAMKQATVVISTAALVYLELETIQTLVQAFASSNEDETNKEDAYMLVNFLNPFALEKADQTKRILLQHLEFVASRATRHRKMSQLEQDNYPGEEWSLLELWVLKKKKTT